MRSGGTRKEDSQTALSAPRASAARLHASSFVGVGGREARTRDECQARGAGARWAGLSSVRACVRPAFLEPTGLKILKKPATPRQKPKYQLSSEDCFETIVREAFSQRRKTLRNGLKKYLNETNIKELGIPLNERAENLEVKDFVNLSNLYYQSKNN